MRKIMIGFILGYIFYSAITFAGENIPDFEPRSVAVLNDRLEQIEADIRDHETRITDLE